MNKRNWKALKSNLNQDSSEVVTDCNQLKLPAEDGKMREVDCANVETLFRNLMGVVDLIKSLEINGFKFFADRKLG